MKKSILLFATAILLTSCVKEFIDNNEGASTSMSNTIVVNAMVGNNVTTRAIFPADASSTSDSLKSINLSGWQSSGVTSLSNVTFTKGDSGFVPAEGTYYWSTGKYSFIAWAKNNAAAKVTDIFATGGTESMTSVTGRYRVENSVKTDATHLPAVQSDPILAVANMEKPQSGNKVDLTFQHLLSRISINLYAPLYLDNTVCLLDFGFGQVDTAGTFTYSISDGTKTSAAFTTDCWTDGSAGKVGEYVAGEGDPSANYWWPAYSGTANATVLTEANRSTYCNLYAPIVPKAMDNVFDKFTIYTTTGTVHTAAGSAPWLNVIPGSNIADSLQICVQIKQKQKESGDTEPKWHVKKLSVSLADLKISGTESKLTNYDPGYQYVYNVRISGQNKDDAETDTARIQIVDVSVKEWQTQSLVQQNTTDIKIGKSLQDLINDIEADGGYGTITLEEDVKLDTTVFLHANKNSDITIDLNGYNIVSRDGKKLGKMFEVASGAVLSIVDNTDSAKDTVTAAANDTIVKVLAGGKATIYDGVFNVSGDNGTVIHNAAASGNVSVKDGTFIKNSTTTPFTGNTTKILFGGIYVGGYVPVTTGDTKIVADGYDATEISDDPVTYQVVQSGEKLLMNQTLSGDVTAD